MKWLKNKLRIRKTMKNKLKTIKATVKAGDNSNTDNGNRLFNSL